jgi:hypothetical protein
MNIQVKPESVFWKFEWVLEMFWTLKHKFASWKPGIVFNSFADAIRIMMESRLY